MVVKDANNCVSNGQQVTISQPRFTSKLYDKPS